MNPRININLKKLTENASMIVSQCEAKEISVSAVTKGFCAMPQAAAALMKGGIKSLADSRLQNLRKLSTLDTEKWLLRLPMVSQADEVVKYADISLNSEWKTLKALDTAAAKAGVKHGVILMCDLGDLREGIYDERVFLELALRTERLRHLALKGVATNLTCFGAIIPDEQNLGRLVSIARRVEQKIGRTLEVISGGNSSSVYMLQEGKIPAGINHLRLGEAILLGTESAYGAKLLGMNYDCFQLTAEIIEVQEKPSMPVGTIGVDAFGQIPIFENRGIRKRAIAAVGKQDLATHPIKPLDEQIEILGASSDHLILDITDTDHAYQVGDELSFSLSYGAMLALTTSPYVATQFMGTK